MGLSKVLDTNAILYIAGGLVEGELPTGNLFASVISEIEAFGFWKLSAEDAETLRALLEDIPVLPLNETVKEGAIDLRRRYRLRTPDAIIAATALAMDADLVSNDVGFDRVTELRVTPLRLKPPVVE